MNKLLPILALLFFSCATKTNNFDLLTHSYTNMVADFENDDFALDCALLYYYSSKVNSWSYPQDTLDIKSTIDILGLNMTIYSSDKNIIWQYPNTKSIDIDNYYFYMDSHTCIDTTFNVSIIWPSEFPLYTSLGEVNDKPGLCVHNFLNYFFITDGNKSIFLD